MTTDDNRQSRRLRALQKAKVVLSDWFAVECLISDISETGARLEFQAPIDLPEEFRVIIVASNEVIPAARAWQRGLAAGVQFTGPGEDAPRRW